MRRDERGVTAALSRPFFATITLHRAAGEGGGEAASGTAQVGEIAL
jgi:hypothetical protein